MLNDEKIKTLTAQHIGEGETNGYYFYGVITASIGDMMLLGCLANMANEYFLVNITNKKVHLYGVDMMGDPKDYSFIPMEQIKKIEMFKWLFGMGRKICITTNDGSQVLFKANKNCMGIKEQKNNLLALDQLYMKG